MFYFNHIEHDDMQPEHMNTVVRNDNDPCFLNIFLCTGNNDDASSFKFIGSSKTSKLRFLQTVKGTAIEEGLDPETAYFGIYERNAIGTRFSSLMENILPVEILTFSTVYIRPSNVGTS